MEPVNYSPDYCVKQKEATGENHRKYTIHSKRPGKGAREFYLGYMVLTDVEAHRFAFELGAELFLLPEKIDDFVRINSTFHNSKVNESTLPNEALDRAS